MLIKVGQANVSARLNDGLETIEMKASFAGYSYEISVKELIEWMVKRFDLMVRMAWGLLKFSRELRKDMPEWIKTIKECKEIAGIDQPAPKTGKETKAE